MDSIQDKVYYEIVDRESGQPITTHFTSRKTLDSAVKTYQKFDPTFHLKHEIMVFEVYFTNYEYIDQSKSVDPEVENPRGKDSAATGGLN